MYEIYIGDINFRFRHLGCVDNYYLISPYENSHVSGNLFDRYGITTVVNRKTLVKLLNLKGVSLYGL